MPPLDLQEQRVANNKFNRDDKIKDNIYGNLLSMPHDRAIIVRCLTALDILLIKQISKYILHLAATCKIYSYLDSYK